MHLVIDADQMIYACGFAAEGEPLSHALKLVKNKLEQIQEDCQFQDGDEMDLYVSGEGNFRDDITFDYKANRTSRKPTYYEEIKQYLIDVWGAKPCNGLEADDMVSSILWQDFKMGGENVILCSPDKDLNNTPGQHYNPRTRELYWVTPEQAERHFYYQLLRGDPVDNIKGLPYCAEATIEKYGLRKSSARKGCGEATAKKIMEEDNWIVNVLEAYAEWGLQKGVSSDATLAYLEQQGQLLWMVREFDEFGEPEMWRVNGLGMLWDDIWKSAERRKSESETCESSQESEEV